MNNKHLVLLFFPLIMVFSGPVVVFGQEAVISKLTASSYLTEPYDYFVYHPVHIFDDNPRTFWFENREDEGKGEYIHIEFEDEVVFDQLSIRGGCFLKNYYKKNYRIRELDIILDNESMTISLDDRMEEQVFVFDAEMKTRTLVFSIADTYKTEKYEDTAISDISLYYRGEKINTDCSKIADILKKQPEKWMDIKLVPEKVGSKWGYVDQTGSFPIPLIYDSAYEFKRGRAIVAIDGDYHHDQLNDERGDYYFFIDKMGTNIVVPPVFVFNETESRESDEYVLDFIPDFYEDNEIGKGLQISDFPYPGASVPDPSNSYMGINPYEGRTYFHLILFDDNTCLKKSWKNCTMRADESCATVGTWHYHEGLVYIIFTEETGRVGIGEEIPGEYYSYYEEYEDYSVGIYRHLTVDWELFYRIGTIDEYVMVWSNYTVIEGRLESPYKR